MSVLPVGFASASGVDVGDIGHSVRQRRAASASWSRTPANNNSRTVWTYSEWIKRGELGTDQLLLDAGTDGNNESAIRLNTSNKLDIYNYVAASYGCRRVTTLVLRDPTAFFHLVVASNGTTSFKIWINGVEITAFDTNSGTNGTNWFFNHSSYAMHMGKRFNNTNYFDGERARGCFIGGSALTAADFGYFNTEINEWVSKSQSAIKALVDAGDSNSTMLDFDDPNFATYNIGKDFSSKGNHWTPTGVNVSSAGSTYDWMLDVPGNSYCTASSIDLGANPASSTLSEANLKSVCAAVSGGSSTCGTQALPDGKWYWEYVPTAVGDGLILGITSRTSGAPSGTAIGYVFNGQKNVGGTASAYGASYAANDVIGVAVDTTANTIEFFKNNTSQGVITNATYVVPGCKPVHWNNSSSGSSTVQHMYGQAPLHASATYHSAAGGYFRYAPPAGFKALCQANLPDPAILNPEKHFDVVTRTGTAATYSVAGLGFQPDLVWVKSRGRAVDHALYDSVRGVQKQLESNQTGAETTESTGLTAFNSGGYTGGALDQINGTTATNSFVDWLWKAGGAPVTNNAGSISSQVSANVDAGFSIVTWTSQPSGTATVGHGLGKVPGLIITKHRNLSTGWQVYHAFANATPQNGGLTLNSTAAYAANSNLWNNTAPTTSVFTSGLYFTANEPIATYCFAEIPGFSKVFSYTGNGSADGPFVECGFKPKFVMIKRTDSTGSWQVFDSIRAGYNVDNDQLVANTSAAEVTTDLLDLTANGFKLRSTSTEVNASGGTYIFIAFADVAGKYSLGR